MPDDEKPKPGIPIPIGVAVTERSTARSSAARDMRTDKRAPSPVAIFVEEDVTGQYAGEDLRVMRSKRTTADRLERLENKHDELKDDFGSRIGKVEVAVADMGGQLKILPSLIETMQNATVAMQQREHVTFTAKVDVDKAQALGAVEVTKAQAIGEVEVKKARWKLYLKIAAIVGTIATALTAALTAGSC